MTPSIRTLLPLALAGFVIASCGDKDDGETGDAAAGCSAPTANAGVDVTGVLGAAVTLDASGSDVCAAFVSDGSATYTWHLESVPVDSRLSDADFTVREGSDAVTTSFTPDVTGDYVVSVTVSDPAGTAQDLVVISIASGNAPPVADCGDDLSARAGDRVEFDGSSSYDPEGVELSWSWSLAVTPDCSTLDSGDLYNSDQPMAALVPDCEGLFMVSLVASDGEQWSDPDYCSLDVADGNRIPEAEAGESLDLPYCAPNPLHLSGWESYDLDGDELEYLWTVVSVPGSSAVTDDSITDPTAVDPLVTWDVPGAYTFELQVYDGTVWSAPDIVTYTIAGVDTNTSPVANAGSDATISAVASCVSSSYVWTCADCPEASALLDGSSSYDSDGDPVVYQWTESSGLATFSNDRSVITDIIVPPQPAEFGVESELDLVATLSVQDCQLEDTDSVNVHYTCTGEYLGE